MIWQHCTSLDRGNMARYENLTVRYKCFSYYQLFQIYMGLQNHFSAMVSRMYLFSLSVQPLDFHQWNELLFNVNGKHNRIMSPYKIEMVPILPLIIYTLICDPRSSWSENAHHSCRHYGYSVLTSHESYGSLLLWHCVAWLLLELFRKVAVSWIPTFPGKGWSRKFHHLAIIL